MQGDVNAIDQVSEALPIREALLDLPDDLIRHSRTFSVGRYARVLARSRVNLRAQEYAAALRCLGNTNAAIPMGRRIGLRIFAIAPDKSVIIKVRAV
jgi:hypothetical protein